MGQDGTISLSWMAALLVVLPFLTALAGLFGFMAGIFGRNWMLTWANFLGLKFVFLSALNNRRNLSALPLIINPCDYH
uniref:Uncharacterized protein n=1 Tax=uncultured bacterium contig00021 TaxID=1181511 RepID=A0A806K2B4_9BACT|nr:hypothetical protein [uncultured bacterium contig00021]